MNAILNTISSIPTLSPCVDDICNSRWLEYSYGPSPLLRFAASTRVSFPNKLEEALVTRSDCVRFQCSQNTILLTSSITTKYWK